MRFISWAIRLLTKGGPEHVRLYMGDNKFTEFTWPKSRWGILAEINLENTKIEIGRNPLIVNLTKSENEKIKKWCENQMGKNYDLKELIWEHLLDELKINKKDDSSKRKFVCSTYIKYAFNSINKDPLPNEPLTSPQDLRKIPGYIIVYKG